MPHYLAKDKNGKLTSALDAESGVNYHCSHCGAVMRVRKCISRSPHFFLFDDKHKSRDCGEFEKERGIIRDPSLINKKRFAKSVLFPRSGNRSNDSGGSSRSNKSSVSAHKEILAPNCLRHLIVCGARDMEPTTPIEDGILSDVYIGPKAYKECISEGIDLGFRVVEMWLDSALDGRIRYIARCKTNGVDFRAFFEHHVDDSVDFEALAKSLFHDCIGNFSHPIWRNAKYKRIAVAGEWTAIARSDCQRKCNFCKGTRTYCRGMWVAPLKHLGQIYKSDLPDNLR